MTKMAKKCSTDKRFIRKENTNYKNPHFRSKCYYLFLIFIFSFSGHKYPPPPLLNLRAVSEGTAPSSSPGWGTEAPTIPPYRGPPLSASGRIQNPHHTDLNNSIGTMSITPNSLGGQSGSTSGGQVGGQGGTHFVFTEATPPPRPPRPTNQLSTFEEAL
jgi:hypothetical protein